MSNKKFTKAFIISGGFATRNAEFTLNNAVPKILLSIGNKTVLDAIYESYSEIVDEVVFVMGNYNQIDQVTEYISARNTIPSDRYSIKLCDKLDGTYSAVCDVLSNLTDDSDENVIISWSDIWINNIDANRLSNYFDVQLARSNKPYFLVVADSNRRHRFEITDNQFENQIMINPNKLASGNICGIYACNVTSTINLLAYLKEHFGKLDLSDRPDLIEVLSKYVNNPNIVPYFGETFDFIEIRDVNDIGDSDKYLKLLDNINISTRFFNDLTYQDDTVTKTSTSEKGISVAINELGFYHALSLLEADGKFLPKLIDFNFTESKSTIVLEKLSDYITLNEYVKDNDVLASSMSKLVISESEKLHKLSTKESVLHDISMQLDKYNIQNLDTKTLSEYILWNRVYELADITILRYSSVKSIIDSVNVKSVNGLSVCEFYDAIQIIRRMFFYSIQEDSISDIFVFGHGDLNSTNIMINPKDMSIKFIDPRGVFGDIKLYTDKEYDLAKIVYGLTGYSKFNLAKSIDMQLSEDGDLILPEYDIVKLLESDLYDHINDRIKVLVGLCWLKLPQYIINNPMKAIAAQNIGLAIINNFSKNV